MSNVVTKTVQGVLVRIENEPQKHLVLWSKEFNHSFMPYTSVPDRLVHKISPPFWFEYDVELLPQADLKYECMNSKAYNLRIPEVSSNPEMRSNLQDNYEVKCIFRTSDDAEHTLTWIDYFTITHSSEVVNRKYIVAEGVYLKAQIPKDLHRTLIYNEIFSFYAVVRLKRTSIYGEIVVWDFEQFIAHGQPCSNTVFLSRIQNTRHSKPSVSPERINPTKPDFMRRDQYTAPPKEHFSRRHYDSIPTGNIREISLSSSPTPPLVVTPLPPRNSVDQRHPESYHLVTPQPRLSFNRESPNPSIAQYSRNPTYQAPSMKKNVQQNFGNQFRNNAYSVCPPKQFIQQGSYELLPPQRPSRSSTMCEPSSLYAQYTVPPPPLPHPSSHENMTYGIPPHIPQYTNPMSGALGQPNSIPPKSAPDRNTFPSYANEPPSSFQGARLNNQSALEYNRSQERNLDRSLMPMRQMSSRAIEYKEPTIEIRALIVYFKDFWHAYSPEYTVFLLIDKSISLAIGKWYFLEVRGRDPVNKILLNEHILSVKQVEEPEGIFTRFLPTRMDSRQGCVIVTLILMPMLDDDDNLYFDHHIFNHFLADDNIIKQARHYLNSPVVAQLTPHSLGWHIERINLYYDDINIKRLEEPFIPYGFQYVDEYHDQINLLDKLKQEKESTDNRDETGKVTEQANIDVEKSPSLEEVQPIVTDEEAKINSLKVYYQELENIVSTIKKGVEQRTSTINKKEKQNKASIPNSDLSKTNDSCQEFSQESVDQSFVENSLLEYQEINKLTVSHQPNALSSENPTMNKVCELAKVDVVQPEPSELLRAGIQESCNSDLGQPSRVDDSVIQQSSIFDDNEDLNENPPSIPDLDETAMEDELENEQPLGSTDTEIFCLGVVVKLYRTGVLLFSPVENVDKVFVKKSLISGSPFERSGTKLVPGVWMRIDQAQPRRPQMYDAECPPIFSHIAMSPPEIANITDTFPDWKQRIFNGVFETYETFILKRYDEVTSVEIDEKLYYCLQSNHTLWVNIPAERLETLVNNGKVSESCEISFWATRLHPKKEIALFLCPDQAIQVIQVDGRESYISPKVVVIAQTQSPESYNNLPEQKSKEVEKISEKTDQLSLENASMKDCPLKKQNPESNMNTKNHENQAMEKHATPYKRPEFCREAPIAASTPYDSEDDKPQSDSLYTLTENASYRGLYNKSSAEQKNKFKISGLENLQKTVIKEDEQLDCTVDSRMKFLNALKILENTAIRQCIEKEGFSDVVPYLLNWRKEKLANLQSNSKESF